MRLATCFVWTCMLLNHDFVWVMDALRLEMATHLTCGVNSTCAERTGQGQVCGCDWWCEVYGDCCSDYTRPDDGSVPPPDDTRPDDGSVPPQDSSLTSRPSNTPLLYPSPVGCVNTRVDGGYLLVNTCPPHWKPDHVSMVCESRSYGLSPAYVIPVTSTKTRLSYKNMFCAYCHGQTLYDIKLWHFSHTCDIGGNGMTFATMFRHGIVATCNIKMDEPTRRGCVVGIRDCGGIDVRTDNTLALARDMCNTYTDYVVSSIAVYKNAYCKHCYQGLDISALTCPDSHSELYAHLLNVQRTVPMSDLAQFHTNYKPPVLNYSVLKEQEAECSYDTTYARNRCWYRGCLEGFKLSGQQCIFWRIFTVVVYCSPGWNFLDQPFRYPSRHVENKGIDIDCVDVNHYAYMHGMSYTEDEMMGNIRSWLEQTNYRMMYMNPSPFQTMREMFGNCQSTTTTGTIADTNARLLAFVESVRYHLMWPWIVKLTVKQGDDGQYLGDVTMCEIESMCSMIRSTVEGLVPELRNVSFSSYRHKYVCEEALKSIERKERDERNEQLAVFLHRAARIHVTDCCTTTKLGVTIVTMLFMWIIWI